MDTFPAASPGSCVLVGVRKDCTCAFLQTWDYDLDASEREEAVRDPKNAGYPSYAFVRVRAVYQTLMTAEA